MNRNLDGIHFMMPTPFDDQKRIDEECVPRLVELAVNAGCSGVVCLGVMGEHTRLTEGERQQIIRAVTQAVQGRISVTVGASAQGSYIAVQNALEAQELGADAVMVAPPSLKKPNLDAVFAYYKAINDAMTIPIVVQDFPEENGVFMPAPFIGRLKEELERVHYLKLEDPPTPPKVTAVRDIAGDTLGIFGGLGGVFLLEELLRGACGTMTGFAYPEVLVNVHRYVVDGQDEQARGYFYRYLPLIRYESQQGIGLSLRKEILKRRGALNTANVRHPGAEVDETTRQELYRTLESMELT